jgi:hypothetical protein
VEHFSEIYEESHVTIVEVVKMETFFLSLLNDKDNVRLLEEASKDELQEVSHSFQNIKAWVLMDSISNFS